MMNVSALNLCFLLCVCSRKLSLLFVCSELPKFCDPKTARNFRTFSKHILSLSTLTCTEWLQLAFQLKWAIGEKADIFMPQLHTSLIQLLQQFEKLYCLLCAEAFTTATMHELEENMADYITQLNTVFGPTSVFAHNMCKPKLHAFSHMVVWIKLFGRVSNCCTSHLEKAHSRTKDTAANTNNRSHQEGTMLKSQIQQNFIATAFTVAGGTLKAAEGPGAAARTVSYMVPAVRKASGLYGSSVPRRMPQSTHDLLLTLLQRHVRSLHVDDAGSHVQGHILLSKLRVHTGYRVATVDTAGRKSCHVSVHSRDMWQAGGCRYDDILVMCRNADGNLEQRYARLEAAISYYGQALLLVRLYTPAAHEKSRRVCISEKYLKHNSEATSCRLLPASALVSRVHLINDTQFGAKYNANVLAGRWFVNPHSDRCL